MLNFDNNILLMFYRLRICLYIFCPTCRLQFLFQIYLYDIIYLLGFYLAKYLDLGLCLYKFYRIYIFLVAKMRSKLRLRKMNMYNHNNFFARMAQVYRRCLCYNLLGRI